MIDNFAVLLPCDVTKGHARLLAVGNPDVFSISVFFFPAEWSRSGRASKEGGGLAKGPLGEPDRVCPHQRGLRSGPG